MIAGFCGVLIAVTALEPILVRDSGHVDGEYMHYTNVNGAPAYLHEDGERMFELYRDMQQTWVIQEYGRTHFGCVEMDKMEYGLKYYFHNSTAFANRPPADGWKVAEQLRHYLANEGLKEAHTPQIACRDACCMEHATEGGAAYSACSDEHSADLDEDSKKHVRNIIRFGLPNEANLQTYLAQRRARHHASFIIVDDFLEDPMSVREQLLSDPAQFHIEGNYPGLRTNSHATAELRAAIQEYLPLEIVSFPDDGYNGAYQISYADQETWIHSDAWNNWAGVLYLTPDAPLGGGTGIFQHKASGARTEAESHYRGIGVDVENDGPNFTQWNLVDTVGNVFNRLVLFDAANFHDSLERFGSNMTNGRLFQTFFFTAIARDHKEKVQPRIVVRISGAGMDFVNGIYQRAGAEGRAPQYALSKAGRTIYLLRVHDEEGDNHWWNILESFANGTHAIYYAAPEHDRGQPPARGWDCQNFLDLPCTGFAPNPIARIMRETTVRNAAVPPLQDRSEL